MDLSDALQRDLDRHGLLARDVEERFVRGAGPGGQKINKTSSTVVLVHRPTGVEVRCQQERSQAANRERAWTLLIEKLATRAREAQETRRAEREKERRRNRQRSHGQKLRLVAEKRQHARKKAGRRTRGDPDA